MQKYFTELRKHRKLFEASLQCLLVCICIPALLKIGPHLGLEGADSTLDRNQNAAALKKVLYCSSTQRVSVDFLNFLKYTRAKVFCKRIWIAHAKNRRDVGIRNYKTWWSRCTNRFCMHERPFSWDQPTIREIKYFWFMEKQFYSSRSHSSSLKTKKTATPIPVRYCYLLISYIYKRSFLGYVFNESKMLFSYKTC